MDSVEVELIRHQKGKGRGPWLPFRRLFRGIRGQDRKPAPVFSRLDDETESSVVPLKASCSVLNTTPFTEPETDPELSESEKKISLKDASPSAEARSNNTHEKPKQEEYRQLDVPRMQRQLLLGSLSSPEIVYQTTSSAVVTVDSNAGEESTIGEGTETILFGGDESIGTVEIDFHQDDSSQGGIFPSFKQMGLEDEASAAHSPTSVNDFFSNSYVNLPKSVVESLAWAFTKSTETNNCDLEDDEDDSRKPMKEIVFSNLDPNVLYSPPQRDLDFTDRPLIESEIVDPSPGSRDEIFASISASDPIFGDSSWQVWNDVALSPPVSEQSSVWPYERELRSSSRNKGSSDALASDKQEPIANIRSIRQRIRRRNKRSHDNRPRNPTTTSRLPGTVDQPTHQGPSEIIPSERSSRDFPPAFVNINRKSNLTGDVLILSSSTGRLRRSTSIGATSAMTESCATVENATITTNQVYGCTVFGNEVTCSEDEDEDDLSSSIEVSQNRSNPAKDENADVFTQLRTDFALTFEGVISGGPSAVRTMLQW